MRRLLVVLIVLLAGCDGDGPKSPRAGDPPPPLVARTLDGQTVTLPADGAGKVAVVRFWASWCAFCKDEMKAIEPVWRERHGDGLLVLAVNAGQGPDEIRAFVAPMGLSYPIVLDPKSQIARAWGVTGLPTTLLIGRDGLVKHRLLGETDPAVFRRLVEAML